MKLKESCSSCGHIFLTSEDDHEDILEELYMCTSCGTTICDDCTLFRDEWSELDWEQYPYLADLGMVCCKPCLSLREQRFVQSLPHNDLPILINHTWLTDSGREFYRSQIF